MSSFFVNGAIAWGTLGLISIPIIIHLIHRRRYLRIDWAAMEFLLEAMRRQRRRIRIEQLILLLVRIAVMALLGLFLARPILSDRGFAWIANALRKEEKIFLLDDSFSMSRRESGRTCFDRSLEALTNQIRKMPERGSGDRLTIIRGARFRNPIIRGGFVDREQALSLADSVSRLKSGDTRLDLAGALGAIADDSALEGEGPGLPRCISIVTDLRAADWMDAGSGGGGASSADEALHRALVRLVGSAQTPTRIVILDMGSEETSNLAITGVAVEGGKAIQNIPVDLRVEVRNFGSAPARGLALRVRYAPAPAVTGEESAATTVLGPSIEEIGPGESTIASIPCTFRGIGDYGVVVELMGASDALPGDDACPLSVEVVSGTDVLVVSGEPSSEYLEGEADFLAEALAPTGEVPSGIRPTIVVEENLPRGELDKYAVVFVLNLHSFPLEFLPLLGKYVREGGTLVIFPGDQVDAALYQRQLGSEVGASTATSKEPASPAVPGPATAASPATGLLPARLGEIAGNPTNPLGIKLDLTHPYFRLIRDGEEWMSMVHVYQYFTLEPVPGAQVLARFTDVDSTPAIVEHAVGRGRVVLFATGADLEWNDWARNPTYLMTVEELVAAVVRARSQREEPVAGNPLEVPVDISQYAQEARLRAPGYPSRPERAIVASPAAKDGGGDSAMFRFVIEDTEQAGLYALQLKSKSGEQEWREIAVRRDPRESNLARIGPAKLRELYPDVEITVLRDAATFSEVGRGGFEASDLLLWAFLGLLFVESMLACYFAHHLRPAAARPTGGGAA